MCAVLGLPEEQAVLQPTTPAFKCLEDRNEIPQVCVILTILRLHKTFYARKGNFYRPSFSSLCMLPYKVCFNEKACLA